MTTHYEKIIEQNLQKVYAPLPHDLDSALPGRKEGDLFYFRAFGEDCTLGPDKISLSEKPATGPTGLLISLYAIHVNPQPIQHEPFKSFKDLPGSMPYQGAFSANSEKVLVPYVPGIKERQEVILDAFDGKNSPEEQAGDFSFVLYSLPKIALSASVTCLFSANALSFMPLDGLADVAEYTSKAIVGLID
jgi:hypothetical protein